MNTSKRKHVHDEHCGCHCHDHHEKIEKHKDPFKSYGTYLWIFAITAAFVVLCVIGAKGAGYIQNEVPGLSLFNTMFISILIQAFPFILIGVFVSSVIQVFISEDMIVRFFPKNNFISFGVAIFTGFLFPVCDCAVIPVAARLVRKGVPIPAAITFMLAAPIVNPVTIASTLYAFPDPAITVYRTGLGLAIAIAVGCFFIVFKEGQSVLIADTDSHGGCECGHCGGEHLHNSSVSEKVKSIFKHAGTEFFSVGQFLIIGAFLSALAQAFVPQEILSEFGQGKLISLLVMMFAAYILALCSTSDAFVARSFIGQIPMSSIMGFIVLGPMMDIKNVLVLFGNFREKFVIKLVSVLTLITFIALYAFSLLNLV